MKRIITTMLVMILIISQNSYIQAEDNVNKVAEVLNKVNVLRGDGSSFKLDQKLNRAEGATFVVRLLGKEEEVMADRGHYVMTGFSDIAAVDWYAPYVGYCVEEGIIDGFVDGTFKPNEELSEKAMVKIILVALGYEYNSDFDWNTVFQQAYGVGLLDEEHYNNGIGQSSSFTRGNVVTLLNDALRMNNYRTGDKMALNLLNDSKVTEQILADEGFIVAPGSNKVESFTRISEGYFSLQFTSEPAIVTEDNIDIKDDQGNSVNVTDVSKTDMNRLYAVRLEEESKDRIYTVEIDGIKDPYGNDFETFQTTFKGYRPEVYDSDIFAISKVQQLSSSKVAVTFTHPLNDKTLDAKYFYIKHDNEVISNGENPGDMSISLSDPYTAVISVKPNMFVENENYTIVVRYELQSDYRVSLNQHEDDEIIFTASNYEEDSFDIWDFEIINDKDLMLTINRPINKTIGEQIFSYYLTNPNGYPVSIEKVTVNNTDDIAMVTLSTRVTLEEDEEYKLMVNQMYTVNRDQSIIEKEYRFEPDRQEIEELEVKGVEQEDTHTVRVFFSQEIEESDATDPNFYYLRKYRGDEEYKAISATYDNDNMSATVYFGQDLTMESKTDYRMYVQKGIRSKMGQELLSTHVEKFEARSRDDIEVSINKAVYLGDNIILLETDLPVGFNETTIDPDNYTLTEYESEEDRENEVSGVFTQVDAVIYYDAMHMLLLVNNFDDENYYGLTIESLVNYSNYYHVDDVKVNVNIATK